jgi:hypothetical protein
LIETLTLAGRETASSVQSPARETQAAADETDQ